MAATTPNTILLQVNGAKRPIFEKPATTTITPGDLLVASTTYVAPATGAATANNRMFALENPYAVTPTSPAISQTYAQYDYVRYVHAQRGDLVYGRLATSQTVSIGDPLFSSTTAGCLVTAAIDTDTLEGSLVGFAEEAVTTTVAVARIKVRIA